MSDTEPAQRYVKRGWFTHGGEADPRRHQRVGITGASCPGTVERKWRSTPVNLLTVADHRYLVAPRGETQWVRNLCVAGEGELRVGRHTEAFRATELPDDEKVKVLRAYLKRWKMEVGVCFGGVSADASDSEIRRIAPNHPVFRLTS